jgi:hypothetical protein
VKLYAARVHSSEHRDPFGIDGVIGIRCILLKIHHQLVDFDRGKPCNRDIEPFHQQDLRELGQLGRRTGYGVGKIVMSIWRMLPQRPVRLSKPQICATNRSWRGRTFGRC